MLKKGDKVRVSYIGWDGEGVIIDVFAPGPVSPSYYYNVRMDTGNEKGHFGAFKEDNVTLIPSEPTDKELADRYRELQKEAGRIQKEATNIAFELERRGFSLSYNGEDFIFVKQEKL